MAYMDITEDEPAPWIYRLWSGIWMVSSALSRRCWTRSKTSIIYPPMMVVLVGLPSVGKGPAIRTAHKLLGTIDYSDGNELMRNKGIRLGPDDTTAPGIFDELCQEASIKTFKIGNQTFQFSNTVIVAEELAVLLHTLDLRFMATLVKLLNCDNVVQHIRSRGRSTVHNPSCAILGGVQPKVLHEIFPERAWGMGLTARILFVNADEGKRVAMFDMDSDDNTDHEEPAHPLFAPMSHDLARVSELSGRFMWLDEAKIRLNEWWLGGEAAATCPKHHRLQHNYGGKRILHATRLSMTHCAARTDNMVVTKDDVDMSLTALAGIEQNMHKIFASMGGEHSASIIIEDVLHEIAAFVSMKKHAMPEYMVKRLIGAKAPAYAVDQIYDQMLNQNTVKDKLLPRSARTPGSTGRRGLVPFDMILDEEDK